MNRRLTRQHAKGVRSRPGGVVLDACLVALFVVLVGPCLQTSAAEPASSQTLLLVVGAPGEPEFATNFVTQAEAWQKAAAQANLQGHTVGLSTIEAPDDLTFFKKTLADQPKDGNARLWLVFIGHGTFDHKEAKFNLRGPDLTATELATWLKPFTRSLIIVNTASSSAPFLNQLSRSNRVIITATRSGHEQNFTRFGRYFVQAIADPKSADLDKDEQVSLLEAFLIGSRNTVEFYKSEGRIATEHSLLDDNGDGLGTPADWYRGIRATKNPKEKGAVDGSIAHRVHLVESASERDLSSAARSRRDVLESAVALLRDNKATIPETQYYQELEKILLELASLYTESTPPATPTR